MTIKIKNLPEFETLFAEYADGNLRIDGLMIDIYLMEYLRNTSEDLYKLTERKDLVGNKLPDEHE